MIGVDGQYMFSFSLGGKKDFIEEAALKSFITIEKGGFSLPTFELEFGSEDESIIPLLNDGAPLNVQYGATRDNLTDVRLFINNFPTIKEGGTQRNYILSGFVHDITYLNQPRNQITAPRSGIDVAKQVAARYFKVNGNATTSTERQKWIQARMTDAQFVKDCILHSLAKNNSFFGTAITTGGDFIVKDVIRYLRDTNYEWRFTQEPKEPNDVGYEEDFVIESRAGLVASLIGYGREKIVYDIENATQRAILEKSRPILSLSRDLSQSKEIQKRNASLGIVNDNVHPQYHDAYQRNVTNLMTLSSIALTTSIPGNKFYPFKCFDSVMFKDKSVEGIGNEQVSEYVSGKYLISTVTKELKQKRFATTVEMCRESFNQVRV